MRHNVQRAMSIHFDQPLWLVLLLLAIPMSLAGFAWLASMSRLRRAVCVLARVLLIAAIASMLAGATAVRETRALTTMIVVDRSGSPAAFALPSDGDADAATAGGRMLAAAVRSGIAASARTPDDRVGVVLAGAAPLAWAAPTRGELPDGPMDSGMPDGSDLAGAVRLARAMAPPDTTLRLVLVSDGNQTAGDLLNEARLARAAGTPIDVVPLRFQVQSEVLVESVDAPTLTPANAPVVVRVTLRATAPATGTLELLDNGVVVDISPRDAASGRRIALPAGRHVEVIETELPRGRVHRLEAVFTADVSGADANKQPGDRVAANNRAEAVTFSTGAGMLLLIDGVGGGNPNGPSATLRDALTSSGLAVQMVSPEAAPRDLLELESFDLVMLVNADAESMREESVDALSRYVTELAGGLVMVGGPDSFGAGGWPGTPIEALLPVRLDLPEQLIKPSAAVVLVLDNSGSMNFSVMGTPYSQQQIANEGAALAIESMDKTDLVGVVTFNSSFRVEVPLQRNREPSALAAKVRSISADGGTYCGPALAHAGTMLDGVEAEVRHIVVLSDGKSEFAEQLPKLSEQIAAKGIRISTIAVGTGADIATMSDMAEKGGGRFYRVIDPTVLPRILVKAVRVVRSPLVREGDFEPVVLATGSPFVQGLPAAIPPLRGLVLTRAREEPTVVYSMAAPTGEPLLAHWNAGLGRVAAFTSDAHHWAEPWLDWAGYGQLWTRIARTIARPPQDRRQEFSMRLDGDVLRLRLDAVDDQARPLDMLAVPGAVYMPDGERVEVRLSQTGPGRYEASVPAERAGTYIATLAPRRGGQAMSPVIGGVSRSSGIEYAQLRSNDALLEAVAAETGGRVIELADLPRTNLFLRDAVRPAEARLPLWPLLLTWSVVLLLADIGTRRIAWDRLLSREFGASLRKEATVAMKGRGEEAAATAERLRRIEPTRGQAVAAGPLDAADAAAIVREQAERRRRERVQAHLRGTQRVADEVQSEARPEPGRPAEEPDAGGLLAAKRRAQRRIDDQREEKDS